MAAEAEANKLIDEMFTEIKRLNTFKNWPFPDTAKCSAAKMAEAGFFNCPSEDEPDLVQCFVCHKKLHGWEADEDPWEEHLSHMKDCTFARIHKPEKDLTISELFEIEAERKMNKVKMLTAKKLQHFKEQYEKLKEFYEDVEHELHQKK